MNQRRSPCRRLCLLSFIVTVVLVAYFELPESSRAMLLQPSIRLKLADSVRAQRDGSAAFAGDSSAKLDNGSPAVIVDPQLNGANDEPTLSNAATASVPSKNGGAAVNGEAAKKPPLAPVTIVIDDFEYVMRFYGGSPGKWVEGAKNCNLGYECTVTGDSSHLTSADAILYDRSAILWKNERIIRHHPAQVSFTLWHESYGNVFKNDPKKHSLVDHFVSFRLDESIPLPYGCDDTISVLSQFDNIVTGMHPRPDQTNLVASFISNCEIPPLNRTGYIAEMMQYIHVDNHGACLRNVEGRWDRHDATRMQTKRDTLKSYKFAIAFENLAEESFVTEKVFDALFSGAVPIYMGAPDIHLHVPGPKSVIRTADFPGPKELAEYLMELDKDDAKYAEYFKWDRAHTQNFVDKYCATPFYCRMCKLVRERKL
eukprot:Opistho-2@63579